MNEINEVFKLANKYATYRGIANTIVLICISLIYVSTNILLWMFLQPFDGIGGFTLAAYSIFSTIIFVYFGKYLINKIFDMGISDIWEYAYAFLVTSLLLFVDIDVFICILTLVTTINYMYSYYISIMIIIFYCFTIIVFYYLYKYVRPDNATMLERAQTKLNFMGMTKGSIVVDLKDVFERD